MEYQCKCSSNQVIFFVVEQAKSVLLENKGAEKIVKTLGVLEKSFDEKSDNRVELAACGSMLNVASDDGMEKKFSFQYFILQIVLGSVERWLTISNEQKKGGQQSKFKERLNIVKGYVQTVTSWLPSFYGNTCISSSCLGLLADSFPQIMEKCKKKAF